MKKIFLIGLVALATVTTISANVETNIKQYKSPNKVKYEKTMQSLNGTSPNKIARIVSDSIAEHVPQKIDFMTTFSSVGAMDNTIMYNYSASLKEFIKRYPDKDIFKLSKEKKQQFYGLVISGQHEHILKSICKSPTLRAMVDSGVEFEYNYSVKSTDEPMGSFSITVEDCKDIEL